MLTLALDCSQNKMVVALLKNQRVLASRSSETQNTSETLLQFIQELQTETQTTLSDITQIFYGKGPGSFTSLRIGLATLWGLFGFREHKPQIATISSLHLRLLSLDVGMQQSSLVVFPARLKKFYVGWMVGQNFTENCLDEVALQQMMAAQKFTHLIGAAQPLGALHGIPKPDTLSAQSFENIHENLISNFEFTPENHFLNYLQPQEDVAQIPNKIL